jgi:hypothetical protein
LFTLNDGSGHAVNTTAGFYYTTEHDGESGNQFIEQVSADMTAALAGATVAVDIATGICTM